MSYNIQTVSSLNGSFKQRHLPKLQKLVNEDQVLTREIPFEEGIKEGALFRQPVYLTRPHGITFSASDSAPTLVAPVAAQTKELSFDAYQMIMRERISYDAADRMAGNEAAYITSTGDLPTWLRLSHMHYVEMMLWYGQSTNGIGVVSSVSTNTITITAASWAPQIWVGSENMRLDVYNSTTFVKTVSVTSYNLDFAVAAGGTVTVDNAIGITGAYVLHPAGSYGNTYRGIDDIITESTSQFGQSPTTYNLLKGIDHDCGSATLKFKTLLHGLAKAKAKGLSKRALLLLSEFSFPDLVDEVEAARTDAQRSGKGHGKDSPFRGTEIERGADSMTVHSPSGTLEIQVSSYCMKGYAYGMIKDGSWKRYGTSDVTFTMPGGKNNEEFYMHLPDVAGYELRTWSNFANYTPRAGSNVRFKNIVNGIDNGT